MLQYAARRACGTSLKRGRLCRWSAAASPHCRPLSSGRAASDLLWTNPNPTVSTRTQQLPQEDGGIRDLRGGAMGLEDEENVLSLTSTTLGREVARIVRSNRDILQQELVDLVLRSDGGGRTGSNKDEAPADTFSLIAKAHGKAARPHLTLDLCEAVQERTGQAFVPSTPRGLVLLLEAMQPKVARYSSSGGLPQEHARAVRDLLERYQQGGKALPATAYKAAIKALDGPDYCTAALELAREARAKLGDSAEGLDELYSMVLNQCEGHRAPDVMRATLEEKREAGGQLSPSGHAYAATLSCLGKAGRVSEALDLFGEMVERGETPNKIAVNHVLAACARDAPNFSRHAKAIFEGMEKRWAIPANVYHYTSMVTCLLKAGQWSEAIAMTDRMEAAGISPNVRFLDHMMQASIGARQWVTAEAIFRAMTEKYGHAAVVSRQSTLHFLQSMVMQKKLRKAVSYVARVQNFSLGGPAPKGTLDFHLLRWFRTIPGVGSEALAGVLMTMVEKGVRLHPDSYSVVISRANQDGNKDLSKTLYNMLLVGNGAPSLSAANAAIKGCPKIESAMEIVASLGEHSLVPDKFTFAALLHACSNADGDQQQAEKGTQVWEAMQSEGVTPHAGMLASYVLTLMRAGRWELALETRQTYNDGNLSRAEKHVNKLEHVSRDDAVVDGVMANGLVDNGQSPRALKYVLGVLEARSKEGGASDGKEFVDEDNHTVLAGIRACRLAGTCEVAAGLLRSCEERWSQGPLAKDLERVEGEGYEWREMLVKTRESRRRLYDCLLSLLDEKGAPDSDIRRVLESGLRNGAVSLMKDQQGGKTAEQAIDFHGWAPRSARRIIRCIVQDIARDEDFLLSTGQYDLGRAVVAQGLREFGDVRERWHTDSPDPRGRRREFADGARPARFGEREYGKGKKRAESWRGWEKAEGGWGGNGADDTQAFWWKKDTRLSVIVGKPRPPPCVRNSVEEFCMLGVTPPLRIRKDATNPGILTIEHEDVQAWLQQGPTFL